MGRLGFLFNPEGNMPSTKIKSRDIEFDFLGLFTETVDGKGNTFNGAIKLEDDSIYVEKRSRLNGKIKDAFNISYDDLNTEILERLAENKFQLNLKDKVILLKTIDEEMINEFETKLINKLTTGSFEVEETPQVQQFVRDIPEEIRKYHELLKDGIITEEEFENKKKALLNS